MRFSRLLAVTAASAVAATATAVAITASVGAGADTPAAPATATATAQLTTINTAAAQKAAQVALDTCQAQGYAVTASVVGRDGALVALLRNEAAMPASVDSANGKAKASAGFRAPSGNLGAAAKDNPGLLQMPGFVVLRGGLPISSGGQVIGAIGVGGAPSGDLDEGCAKAALDAIAAQL